MSCGVMPESGRHPDSGITRAVRGHLEWGRLRKVMDLAGRGPDGHPGVQGPAAARTGGGIVVLDAVWDLGARKRAARVARLSARLPVTLPPAGLPPLPQLRRCWNCSGRAGAPARQRARPGLRPSRGVRQPDPEDPQSRHRVPRVPPSGRKPGGPMNQDRQSFLTRDACLPCPLPVTAASAVLVGGPMGKRHTLSKRNAGR